VRRVRKSQRRPAVESREWQVSWERFLTVTARFGVYFLPMNIPRFCFAAMLWIAGSANAIPASRVYDSAADDSEAALFVNRFYVAFDTRDYRTLERLFAPAAKIVHSDGVTTDIPRMLSIIRAKKVWAPRKRDLSGFETLRIGNVVIVGCLNRVVFEGQGGEPDERTFNETWVLEQTGRDFRVVRVHYSLVTRSEHSE
jgi:hypothetical protein